MLIKQSELDEKVEKHNKWLVNENGGERLVLIGADLIGADLTDAVLTDAVLTDADLTSRS